MPVKSSPKPSGWTNPVEVQCSNCGTKSYVHPGQVKSSGGWECCACGKRYN
jgi:hypothetical protein